MGDSIANTDGFLQPVARLIAELRALPQEVPIPVDEPQERSEVELVE